MDGSINGHERCADALGARDHAAEPNRQVRHIGEQVGDGAVAEMIGAVEMPDERGQARPVAGGCLGYGRRRDSGGAGRATDRVLDVIGDLRADGGQFPDLGDAWCAHIGQGRVERGMAGGAGAWMERHDRIRLTALASMAGMAWLPASFSPTWHLGRARRRAWWVG